MKCSLTFLAFCFLFALPISASQSGQPLDCEDWTFQQAGFSCSEIIPRDCTENELCQAGRWARPVDNQGQLITVRWSTLGSCNSLPMYQTRIVVLDPTGGGENLIGQITDRCNASGTVDQAKPWLPGSTSGYSVLSFDHLNGILYLSLDTYCKGGCPYAEQTSLIAIVGFTRLFDVIQTYTPASTDVGITVPAIPEGLPSADHFDTYWGNVSTLPDFTQAQPLSCGYPASPPAVGDFLTVTDISPIPPVGQVNYIVTAVTHGTDRRYGRQLIGPTMTGRNPALLPVCQ